MRTGILGYGFTGPYLENQIPNAEILFRTKRQAADGFVQFDFEKTNSWGNLESVEQTYWLAPTPALSTLQRFWSENKEKLGRIVVCSSTGFFDTKAPDEVVNERSKIKADNARANAEEFLRTEGAMIVHSSGIYGSNRNPIQWVRSGRIKSSSKFINLVHVEDLSQFLVNAMRYGTEGSRYIASDNHPYRWGDLIKKWNDLYKLYLDMPQESGAVDSKIVDSGETIAALKIELKHPDSALGVKDLVGELRNG